MISHEEQLKWKGNIKKQVEFLGTFSEEMETLISDLKTADTQSLMDSEAFQNVKHALEEMQERLKSMHDEAGREDAWNQINLNAQLEKLKNAAQNYVANQEKELQDQKNVETAKWVSEVGKLRDYATQKLDVVGKFDSIQYKKQIIDAYGGKLSQFEGASKSMSMSERQAEIALDIFLYPERSLEYASEQELVQFLKEQVPDAEPSAFVQDSKEIAERRALRESMQKQIRSKILRETKRKSAIKTADWKNTENFQNSDIGRCCEAITEFVTTQEEYDSIVSVFAREDDGNRRKRTEIFQEKLKQIQEELQKRNLDFEHLTDASIAENYDYIRYAKTCLEVIVDFVRNEQKKKEELSKTVPEMVEQEYHQKMENELRKTLTEQIKAELKKENDGITEEELNRKTAQNVDAELKNKLKELQKTRLQEEVKKATFLDINPDEAKAVYHTLAQYSGMLHVAVSRGFQFCNRYYPYCNLDYLSAEQLDQIDYDNSDNVVLFSSLLIANQETRGNFQYLCASNVATQLKDYDLTQVKWLDENANPLKAELELLVPTDVFQKEEALLIAQLPDGSMKVFQRKPAENGFVRVEAGDESKVFSILANPATVEHLMSDLEASDSPLIWSSDEFNDVKRELEKLQKSMEDPDYLKNLEEPWNQVKLHQQLAKLKEAANEYVEMKEEEVQGNPNETEARRIAAVKKIRDYATNRAKAFGSLYAVTECGTFKKLDEILSRYNSGISEKQLDIVLTEHFTWASNPNEQPVEPQKVLQYMQEHVPGLDARAFIQDSKDIAARQSVQSRTQQQFRKFMQQLLQKNNSLHTIKAGQVKASDSIKRSFPLIMARTATQKEYDDWADILTAKEPEGNRARTDFLLKELKQIDAELQNINCDEEHWKDAYIAEHVGVLLSSSLILTSIYDELVNSNGDKTKNQYFDVNTEDKNFVRSIVQKYEGLLAATRSRVADIFNPYYNYLDTEYLSTEQEELLTGMEFQDLLDGEGLDWNLSGNYVSWDEAVRSTGLRLICDRYLEKQLEGLDYAKVKWFDEDGCALSKNESEKVPQAGPLMRGKAMIACLPDGSMRIFRNTTGGRTIPKMEMEGESEALSALMNPAKIETFLQQLKSAGVNSEKLNNALETVLQKMKKPESVDDLWTLAHFDASIRNLDSVTNEYMMDMTDEGAIQAVKNIHVYAQNMQNCFGSLYAVQEARRYYKGCGLESFDSEFLSINSERKLEIALEAYFHPERGGDYVSPETVKKLMQERMPDVDSRVFVQDRGEIAARENLRTTIQNQYRLDMGKRLQFNQAIKQLAERELVVHSGSARQFYYLMNSATTQKEYDNEIAIFKKVSKAENGKAEEENGKSEEEKRKVEEEKRKVETENRRKRTAFMLKKLENTLSEVQERKLDPTNLTDADIAENFEFIHQAYMVITTIYDIFYPEQQTREKLKRTITETVEKEFCQKVEDDLRQSLAEKFKAELQKEYEGKPEEELNSAVAQKVDEELQKEEQKAKLAQKQKEELNNNKEKLEQVIAERLNPEVEKATILDFTDDELQFVFDCQKKYGNLLTRVYNRGAEIINPYYPYIKPDYLSLTQLDTMGGMGESSADYPNMFATFLMANHAVRHKASIVVFGDELETQMKDYNLSDVRWVNEEGSPINLDQWTGLPNTEPLAEGNSLIACLPDGSMKIFRGVFEPNAFPKLEAGDEEKALSALMNPVLSEKLIKDLEAADPPYIKSSDAFKDVKNILQKLQEDLKDARGLGDTRNQINLNIRLQRLQEAASKYVRNKEEEVQGNPNKTEAKRIAAVKQIRDFAARQQSVVANLFSVREANRQDTSNIENVSAFEKKPKDMNERQTSDVLLDELEMQMKDYNLSDVRWVNEEGSPIELEEGKRLPNTVPLAEGHSLIACLPDGRMKIFRGVTEQNAFPKLEAGDEEKALSALMNPVLSETLIRDLEAADPPYIKSSDAFKDVKNILQKLQENLKEDMKEGRGLGDTWNQVNLNTRLQRLQEAASKYVRNKEEEVQGNPNKTEAKRIAAVKQIRDFAARQQSVVANLFSVREADRQDERNIENVYTFDLKREKTMNERQMEIALELLSHKERDLERVSPQAAMQVLKEIAPDVDDRVFIKDSREIAARQALSNKVMKQFQSPMRRSQQQQNSLNLVAENKIVARAGMQRGFKTLMAYAKTQEEYDKGVQLFTGRDDQNRRDRTKALLMNLKNMQKEIQRRGLDFNHMTDDRIADNFEFICHARLVMTIVYDEVKAEKLGREEVREKIKEEIRKEIRKEIKEPEKVIAEKLEQAVDEKLKSKEWQEKEQEELKKVTYLDIKPEEIQAVSEFKNQYEGLLQTAYLRGCLFTNLYYPYCDVDSLKEQADEIDIFPTNKCRQSLNLLLKDYQMTRVTVGCACAGYVATQMKDYDLTKVQWMDENGTILDPNPDYMVPSELFIQEKASLIAQLPDGSLRIFQSTHRENEFPKMEIGDTAKAISTMMNAGLPALAKALESVDQSSIQNPEQIKAVQEALKAVQEQLKQSDQLSLPEGQEELYEYMTTLSEAAKNCVAGEKIPAVEDIQKYTDRWNKKLKDLDAVKQSLEMKQEIQECRTIREKETALIELQKNFTGGIGNCINENLDSLARCDKQVLQGTGPMNQQEREIAEDAMARMTVLHLALRENRQGRSDMEAGLKEDKAVNQLKQSAVFQKKVKDMSREQVKDFILKNDSFRLARDLIKGAKAMQRKKEASDGLKNSSPEKKKEGMKK